MKVIVGIGIPGYEVFVICLIVGKCRLGCRNIWEKVKVLKVGTVGLGQAGIKKVIIKVAVMEMIILRRIEGMRIIKDNERNFVWSGNNHG